jgi:hypothetical protein
MRSDSPVAAGRGSKSAAPAPSESIQRRKSLSKAISGFCSRAAALDSTSSEKRPERIMAEESSEPQATARRNSPVATPMAAYFMAVRLDRHTPPEDKSSQGGEPSSPWTMLAWLGIS